MKISVQGRRAVMQDVHSESVMVNPVLHERPLCLH